MDLTNLAKKIQSSLLATTTQVSRLETARDLLESQHRGEEEKLEKHYQTVLARLESARNNVRLKLKEEVQKVLERMSDQEQQLRSSCLLLELELADIQHLASEGGDGLAASEASIRLERIQHHLEEQPDVCPITPRFLPSVVLNRLRQQDFGFLQLAEFLPKDFTLELSTPLSSIREGAKVVCKVVTTKQFTSAIQSKVKFVIKRDLQAVSFIREECQVSQDLKSFTMVFLVDQPGVYTVTVQLYDQNIRKSPLPLHIQDSNLADMCNAQLLEPKSEPKQYVEPVKTSTSEPSNTIQVEDSRIKTTEDLPETSSSLVRTPPVELEKSSTADQLASSLPPLPKEYENSLSVTQGVEALSEKAQVTVPLSDVVPDQVDVHQYPAYDCRLRLSEIKNETMKTTMSKHETMETIMTKNETMMTTMTMNETMKTTMTKDQSPEKSVTSQPATPALPPLRRPSQPILPSKTEKSAVAQLSAPLTVTISHKQDSRKVTNTRPRQNVVSKITDQVWQPSKPLSKVDFTKLINLAIPLPKVTMVLEGPSSEKDSQATVFRPIGICLLPDKQVVVASTFEHKVKMFSSSGQFLRQLVPGGRNESFKRPSDMVTLRSGNFVVRDNNGIRFFNNTGDFIMTLNCNQVNRSYGLAEDGSGLLVIINERKGSKVETGVETELLFFEVKTGELVKRIELSDVIRDKKGSKCRFLTSALGKLYITDLGLDCVYTLDPETRETTVFGQSGSGIGCFSDPAGLVVDSLGNMLVADSKNHRVCLYSRTNKFLGELRLVPGARRPSGLLLDRGNGDLYLLNLGGGQAVVRYSLQ